MKQTLLTLLLVFPILAWAVEPQAKSEEDGQASGQFPPVTTPDHQQSPPGQVQAKQTLRDRHLENPIKPLVTK